MLCVKKSYSKYSKSEQVKYLSWALVFEIIKTNYFDDVAIEVAEEASQSDPSVKKMNVM